MSKKPQKNILWFKDITINDVPLVGGKNASLGEMIRTLSPKGMPIPDGFATTSKAYFYFLEKEGLKAKIKSIISDLDIKNIKNLQTRGKTIRDLILKEKLQDDLQKDILKAYRLLSKEYGKKDVDVAVRSSATAEDLPTASFAGQQESYLNISGEKNLIEAVQKCFASLFTDRAIVYREENGFDHLKIALSVGIQKMVRSDLASSGVMFSCDTESSFPDVVLINTSYGLGENIVQGKVDPDQYYVFETTLKQGFGAIIEKKIGSKGIKLIYSRGKKPTRNVAVPLKDRQKFVLTDEEILNLARYSMMIEEHYKKPMDTEWAKDGRDQKLYILQARPETVQSRKNVNVLEEYVLEKSKIKSLPRTVPPKAGLVRGQKSKILITGLSVGSKIGQGKVNRIMDAKNINKFKRGEVLVTDMTDPDWVPVMKLASAIVTDSGGRTAHAAIVSRELGIPCIVGTGRATKVLKTGENITVSCAEGEVGKVYQGLIPFKIKRTDISKIPRTKTKITMNLGEPDQAFGLSFLPNDGVGLAREEFIIANAIKIHPLALINYKKLPTIFKNKIDKLTFGYKDKVQFFVDKLAEGMGKIASAFFPKEIIVRFSDFKTNEYRNLIGGKFYEGEESNPMMGFRGACRYISETFQPAFLLECEAIKKARNIFGLKNVNVMIPFCRTIEEGKKVLEIMKKAGLERGKDGLKVYVMCEIPSNVILADKFLEIFDGFSIGSNDLTQLILGLDRDNAQIAYIGDERNEAVKEMLRKVIKTCREKKKYIGICGEAPSNYPEFAEFLVEQGIESMSLNPSVVIKTHLIVAGKEKQKKNNKE